MSTNIQDNHPVLAKQFKGDRSKFEMENLIMGYVEYIDCGCTILQWLYSYTM